MRRFASREKLIEYYVRCKLDLGMDCYNEWLESLSVKGDELGRDLYHLSHQEALEGEIEPSRRIGDDLLQVMHKLDSFLFEPIDFGISVSSSKQGCYNALYTRYSKMLPLGVGNIDCVFYKVDVSNARVIPYEVLCEQMLIFDAHVTYEHLILDRVVFEVDERLTLSLSGIDLDMSDEVYTPFDLNLDDPIHIPRNYKVV